MLVDISTVSKLNYTSRVITIAAFFFFFFLFISNVFRIQFDLVQSGDESS